MARHLAQYDIGQTVVIAESACVAVEAMEGTDATILRAGEIMSTVREKPVTMRDVGHRDHDLADERRG